MRLDHLTVALGAVATITEAAQEPSITQAPSAVLQERQIGISSVHYTSCTISSGLAVPQPSGASCGLAAAAIKSANSQLIQTYTDANSTASYIACSENCLAASGCTQIFFAAGSTCSLYSGTSLWAAGTSGLTYYELACFECNQTPLSTSASGTKATASSRPKVSTATAKISASSPTSSTQPAIPWTSVQTNPKSYNMALTTVFTPPPECTGSFTQIGSNYWEDVIVPAPHTTLTSCYPSQFYSSAVGAANSVPLPPFNPLVCPSGWSSLPYNTTYIVCCPNGWGAYAPNLNNTQRPLSGAICTSIVISGMLMDVTSYDSTGNTTVLPLTAGSAGAFLLASGFDGIAGVAASTTTSATVRSPTSTTAKVKSTISTNAQSSTSSPAVIRSSGTTPVSNRKTTTHS